LEAEIEQFEAQQQIQSPKFSPKLQRWLLIGSLAMFVAIYTSIFSPKTLVILVGVLLLHEGGHVMAMKIFGYQDVTMLFIPFLGALATAKKEDATLSEKVWISLAGPLPGLILGVGLAIAFSASQFLTTPLISSSTPASMPSSPSELETWIRPLILTLIGLNLFNLLPVYPLDGGQVADLLLFSSNPYLGVLFKGLGVGLLILLGLKQPLLLVFAALIALSIPHSFRVTKLHNRLQKDLKQNPTNDRAEIIHRIFENLQQPQYIKFNFLQKLAIAKSILDSLKERTASWQTRLGLSLIYVISLIAGLIGGLYAIFPYPQVWASMAQVFWTYGRDGTRFVMDRAKENVKTASREIEINPQNADAYQRRASSYLLLVSNQVRMGISEREEGSIKAWQKKSNTERPCALQV